MRRFSTDRITSLRGVRHEPSISFNTINKSLSDSSFIISPVKPPASNHRIPDRKPQSCRCMFICVCVCVCVCVRHRLFLCVFLDSHKMFICF